MLVETEGKRVLQAQRSGQLPLDWSAADCRDRGEDDAGLLRQRWGHGAAGDRRREDVAAAEDQGEAAAARQEGHGRCRRGSRAPTSSYKEFKIVAFYDETQEHRLVCGTRGDYEVAGRLMRREAGRIRLDQADEKVGNVDGSPWIRNKIERQSLPLDDLGLDFYHLSENVHKARREIYGEDDEAGKQWADELLHTFKHDGYEATWQQLLEWRVGAASRPAARRRIGC